MTGVTEGLARSVHDRLIARAKRMGLNPNHVLTRYALERFLYRLSCSQHGDRFILKGALLLLAWLGETLRPTLDADFLGLGDLPDEELLGIVRTVCRQPVPDDGMLYDPESITMKEIREDDAYGGRRVKLFGHLGNGRFRLQLDVGIGDAMEPPPEWLDYPALLNFPAPKIQAYRPETVVAEKVQAMVDRSLLNTRMKDFYDVYVLAEAYAFESELLVDAVRATFRRRGTAMPDGPPVALTAEMDTEETRGRWAAFVGRNELEAPAFAEVQARLAELLDPVWRG
jgi:Nucleotidyl transferase AbiEii toxin, Type IV TA system